MKRILFATVVLAFLLSGCGESSSMQVTDPQQPITTGADREFTIVIEANPTTGYHWELVGDLDRNVVEFVKKEYTFTSAPNLAGGGGLDVWTFKAVNAGEAQITLGYYPPSNDPVEPQQTTTFTVVVK